MKGTVFHLTSPPMSGANQLQRDVNAHLKAWGVPPHQRLREDGHYGPLTRTRTLEVCFGLGIAHTATAHGIGPVTRTKIRHNSLLTEHERKRMQERAAWRHRLAWRLSGGGAGHAVGFALDMAARHITEHPPNSNLGPYITNWEHMAGYATGRVGVYWCGCFVNACLVASGMHTQAHWGIGYVPNIEAHAKGGVDGWRWHPASATPHAGWVATFGHSVGEHTEFVVHTGWPLRTVGGNTSSQGGSPNNGGGVFYHDFSKYVGFPLRGFAEPNYH